MLCNRRLTFSFTPKASSNGEQTTLGTPKFQGQAKLRGRGTRQPDPSLPRGRASSAPHHLQPLLRHAGETHIAALFSYRGITRIWQSASFAPQGSGGVTLLHPLPTGTVTNPIWEKSSHLMDSYGTGGRCCLHLLPALEVVNQGAEAELSLPRPWVCRATKDALSLGW